MITKEQITYLADEYINEPIFLVDINIRPGNVIVIEIDSEDGVSIDDCISLSRKIESQLDRDVEDFELEVGSAGITSPFKTLRQYKKNVGKEVEVLTKGGKKLSGVLKSCDDNGFVVTTTAKIKPEGAKKKIEVQEDAALKYDEVKHTKYQIRFK